MWDPRQLIRKGRERHIFLFDLYLLFCKEVRDPSGNKTKYAYKQRLVTSELGVTEHIEGDECKFAVWTARTGVSDGKVLPLHIDLFNICYLFRDFFHQSNE